MSSSQELNLGIRQVVEEGLDLLNRMGVKDGQTVPSLDQVQTVEAARLAGAQAAVQALLTVIGNLAHPRYTPTLEQVQQALENLRQRGVIYTAYGEIFDQALTNFCERLEALLKQ